MRDPAKLQRAMQIMQAFGPESLLREANSATDFAAKLQGQPMQQEMMEHRNQLGQEEVNQIPLMRRLLEQRLMGGEQEMESGRMRMQQMLQEMELARRQEEWFKNSGAPAEDPRMALIGEALGEYR